MLLKISRAFCHCFPLAVYHNYFSKHKHSLQKNELSAALQGEKRIKVALLISTSYEVYSRSNCYAQQEIVLLISAKKYKYSTNQ